MTVDGKQYVVAGFPGRRLGGQRAGRRRGDPRHAAATPSGCGWSSCPPTDARPILRVFPTEVPTGVGFMKRAGLVTEGRPEEFEALAGRCAVFRLDPV